MINYLSIIKKYADRNIFELIDGDRSVYKTYEGYYRDIRQCAYAIDELACNQTGVHIGIIGKNRYEYLVIMAATFFGRAVAIPLNYRENRESILSAIRNSDVELVIATDDIDSYCFDNVTVTTYEKLMNSAMLKEKELRDFDANEYSNLALICHTSGTTGLSKGVALSVGNLFDDNRDILPINIDMKIRQSVTVAYTNFAFYHIGGILIWLGITESGGTICVSKDSRNVLYDIKNSKIEFAAATPALLKLWANCLKRDHSERLGSLKYVFTGGAPLDYDIVELFSCHGIHIGQYYGQTEIGGVATFNPDVGSCGNSVGKPTKGVSIKVLNGELCIESSGNMHGYYNNPGDTKKYLKDDIIHTGDLGYIDDEGYVYITGRKKNLIVLSGGEKVCPEELETKLYKNPFIKECMVYEKNDRIYVDIYGPETNGNEVKKLIKEINMTMPFYKRISHFDLKKNELMKTPSGKIKRRLVGRNKEYGNNNRRA